MESLFDLKSKKQVRKVRFKTFEEALEFLQGSEDFLSKMRPVRSQDKFKIEVLVGDESAKRLGMSCVYASDSKDGNLLVGISHFLDGPYFCSIFTGFHESRKSLDLLYSGINLIERFYKETGFKRGVILTPWRSKFGCGFRVFEKGNSPTRLCRKHFRSSKPSSQLLQDVLEWEKKSKDFDFDEYHSKGFRL